MGKISSSASVKSVGAWSRHWQLYLLLLLPMSYLLIFCYTPMAGLLIAFQDYSIRGGIFGSEWVGFKNFERFFSSVYFERTVTNTLVLSTLGIISGMPFAILLALCLNEMRNGVPKRFVQMVTYAPYFISTVVIVALLNQWTELKTGMINHIIVALGGKATDFMGKAKYFRFMYTASGVWQMMGFNSIVYLAALNNVDPSLHEAAIVDGASRFKQVRYIDLPAILPTMTIMLILNCGGILSVGFEKVYLMQTPLNLKHSQIISTYIYEMGMKKQDISFATAAGLFNSVVNFTLVLIVNKIAKKLGETSLW
ncbi:MAG: ABC transporter permease [Christensenellales bacterium]